MILLPLLIGICYLGLLLYFAQGFSRVPKISLKPIKEITPFSILIPFRDEAHRIGPLLESLKELNYPKDCYELIFIDDDTTPDTGLRIKKALENTQINFKILQNQRKSLSPKKDALSCGIEDAKFEWNLTTDADCALPHNWLHALNGTINSQGAQMILGPVYFGLGRSSRLLKHLIQFEANALQIIAIGSLGQARPILANGANLGYKKSWFNKVNGFKGNDHIASGDDIFMLQKATNNQLKIAYVNTPEALVFTHIAASWKDYFSQRIRWASKTKQVTSPLARFTGLIFVLTNFWWIFLLFALVFKGETYWHWALFALLKIIADFWFLKLGKNLGLLACTRWFLIASLVYPFASTAVFIGSMIGSFTWKKRRFKK